MRSVMRFCRSINGGIYSAAYNAVCDPVNEAVYWVANSQTYEAVHIAVKEAADDDN